MFAPCNVARQRRSNVTSTLRCNYATLQASVRLLQPSCNVAATKCAVWISIQIVISKYNISLINDVCKRFGCVPTRIKLWGRIN